MFKVRRPAVLVNVSCTGHKYASYQDFLVGGKILFGTASDGGQTLLSRPLTIPLWCAVIRFLRFGCVFNMRHLVVCQEAERVCGC